MKTLFLIMAMSMAMWSCQTDDNSNDNQIVTPQDLTGTWKITSLVDSGKDETYHFTGYVFTFNGNVITATGQGNVVTGVSTFQNSSSGATKWIIQFAEIEPWEALNEDWMVLEKTSTIIRLRHVSGGNGGTDELTFQRN